MFQRFPKIQNSYKKKDIEIARMIVPTDEIWVVEEKIDGANLSFWCDGTTVKMAKRSGWVGTDGSFFQANSVLERLHDHVLDFYSEIVVKCPDIVDGSTVAIYGELYGQGVQNRCFYRPDQDFIAFDIWVQDIGFLQCTHGAFQLLATHCVDVNPIIFRGTLDECLEFEPNFESILTEDIGANIPEGAKTLAEGVVIKPNHPHFFNSGKRVIFKNKNPNFKEKGAKTGKKQKPVAQDLPDAVREDLESITDYLNENRVRTAVSKHGTPKQKDFGKLLGETVQDALEDWKDDNNVDDVRSHFDEHWRTVSKIINSHAASAVRPVFLEYV